MKKKGQTVSKGLYALFAGDESLHADSVLSCFLERLLFSYERNFGICKRATAITSKQA